MRHQSNFIEEGIVILSQSNQVIVNYGAEMSGLEMMFRQQMRFQKQQSEQMLALQKQQAAQQAEFQQKMFEFMKSANS